MTVQLTAATRLVESAGISNAEDKKLPKGWSIDRWYNREMRSWCAQLKDSKGNQVGEAHYVYSKGEVQNITLDSWSQHDIDDHLET